MSITVKENNWTPEVTAEEAIEDILRGSRPGYPIDDVEGALENIFEVLSKFIGPQMKSAEDINNLAGWSRYQDIDEE